MHYELVTNKDQGTYRARLVADNGQILFWTETYTRKESAMDAIRLVQPATHDPHGNMIRAAYTQQVNIVETTE